MAYRCDQAVFGAAREAIRCKVSGSVCAHQKMCMMEGRTVLTDGAMRCPGRSGTLEDNASESRSAALMSADAPRPGISEAGAAEKKKAGTAAKTQQKKTAVRPAAKKRSTAVSTRKTVRKTADKK